MRRNILFLIFLTFLYQQLALVRLSENYIPGMQNGLRPLATDEGGRFTKDTTAATTEQAQLLLEEILDKMEKLAADLNPKLARAEDKEPYLKGTRLGYGIEHGISNHKLILVLSKGDPQELIAKRTLCCISSYSIAIRVINAIIDYLREGKKLAEFKEQATGIPEYTLANDTATFAIKSFERGDLEEGHIPQLREINKWLEDILKNLEKFLNIITKLYPAIEIVIERQSRAEFIGFAGTTEIAIASSILRPLAAREENIGVVGDPTCR